MPFDSIMPSNTTGCIELSSFSGVLGPKFIGLMILVSILLTLVLGGTLVYIVVTYNAAIEMALGPTL